MENQFLASNQKLIQQAIDVVVNALDQKNHSTIKTFMLEIAMVESVLGTHPTTNTNPVDRGVWQINKVGLRDTQDVKSHPKLKIAFKIIKNTFGIDWTKIQHQDCVKILYGCLACRLKLKAIPHKFNFTAQDKDLKLRALYWKKWYNTSLGEGSVEGYVQKVKELRERLQNLSV